MHKMAQVFGLRRFEFLPALQQTIAPLAAEAETHHILASFANNATARLFVGKPLQPIVH